MFWNLGLRNRINMLLNYMIQKPTGVPKNELQIAFRLNFTGQVLTLMWLFFHNTKDHFKWWSKVQVQWKQAILLDESYKLNTRPLDEGSRSKKWQIEANSIWHHFGRKINRLKSKINEIKGRAHDLKKMQARVQGSSPTQGFNLLQMSPNLDPGPHLKWA